MEIPRRQFLGLAMAAIVVPTRVGAASTESYPIRSVRLISGFPPGAANDFAARLIAKCLSERLGQNFIVENRPGAGSNMATEVVVRATPDGYTLLMVATPNAINSALYEKLSFNFVRDITPVAAVMWVPNVMVVHPSIPAETLPEFIAYAKANPGKLMMASPGNGSSGHVSGELFKMMTGVDLLHIPYRGGAPALTDLIAGRVQLFFNPLPTMLGYIKAGTVRALAVTAARRSAVLPNVPTVGEFVPGYEAITWFGIGAPGGTPAGIIDKLNSEINAGMRDPDVQARLAEQGGTVLPGSPADFAKLIADETEKWATVVRSVGIKIE
jgi:tripartite-type tricarboxylate transporter receptor subunit TctC